MKVDINDYDCFFYHPSITTKNFNFSIEKQKPKTI